MSKTKKIISAIIIIILALTILFTMIYSFQEAKKLARYQEATNKIEKDLEIARKKLQAENQRLMDIRVNSYFYKISQEEYEKTRKLIEKLDIFFKNPESDRPEIQLPTKNKIIESEINARRLKITEILEVWSYNNANSVETDQKLIEEIKTALLIIQAYVNQLENIVSNLYPNSSGLTSSQINSYTALIQENLSDLNNIISTINETETIINSTASSTINQQTEDINNQIEIINNTENEISNLENELADQQITATTTATSTATTTISEIEEPESSYINLQDSGIIYQYKPTTFVNTGVDIVNDVISKPEPLQDW